MRLELPAAIKQVAVCIDCSAVHLKLTYDADNGGFAMFMWHPASAVKLMRQSKNLTAYRILCCTAAVLAG
jgi:hypothetical protein